MERMSVVDAVKKAVREDSPYVAGAVAEVLRFKCRLTYAEIAAFANKHTGISAGEWESLMYRADTEE